jgi:hypothetical protein
MAHLESRISGFNAVAFYGRPVLNQRGAFDDRGNPAEKFLGGWVQRAVGSGPGAPMINVRPQLRLRAGSDIIYRLSKHDAVYTIPGVPLIPGTGTGGSICQLVQRGHS